MREETAEACAERLIRWLTSLAGIDPLLGEWFELARSKRAARSHPIDVRDAERILALVRRGVNRRDTDHQPIPDLGFRVGAWNGLDAQEVSLIAHCGSYSPWVHSSLVLNLPSAGHAPSLYRRPVAVAILSATVSAYDPDWALVTTDELGRAQPPRFRPVPKGEPPGVPNGALGWLTYLARRIAPGEVPVPELRASPLGEGSIIETVAELAELTPEELAALASNPAVRALFDNPRG